MSLPRGLMWEPASPNELPVGGHADHMGNRLFRATTLAMSMQGWEKAKTSPPPNPPTPPLSHPTPPPFKAGQKTWWEFSHSQLEKCTRECLVFQQITKHSFRPFFTFEPLNFTRFYTLKRSWGERLSIQNACCTRVGARMWSPASIEHNRSYAGWRQVGWGTDPTPLTT